MAFNSAWNGPHTTMSGSIPYTYFAGNHGELYYPSVIESQPTLTTRYNPGALTLPPPICDSKPQLTQPATLSRYHQANVDALYKNIRYQCNICGFRLQTKEALSDHLNEHYYAKGRGKVQQKAKFQRQWNLSAIQWITTNGGTERQVQATLDEAKETTIKDGSIVRLEAEDIEMSPLCHACGDQMDQLEYDDRGWFFPNAVRSPDGQNYYHSECAPFVTVATKQEPSKSSKKRLFDSSAATSFDETIPSAKRRINN